MKTAIKFTVFAAITAAIGSIADSAKSAGGNYNISQSIISSGSTTAGSGGVYSINRTIG